MGAVMGAEVWPEHRRAEGWFVPCASLTPRNNTSKDETIHINNPVRASGRAISRWMGENQMVRGKTELGREHAAIPHRRHLRDMLRQRRTHKQATIVHSIGKAGGHHAIRSRSAHQFAKAHELVGHSIRRTESTQTTEPI